MKNSLWLIWSIEHNMWWKSNANGYTPHRLEAGLYTFDMAKGIVAQANIMERDTPNEAMILYSFLKDVEAYEHKKPTDA